MSRPPLLPELFGLTQLTPTGEPFPPCSLALSILSLNNAQCAVPALCTLSCIEVQGGPPLSLAYVYVNIPWH